MKSTASALRKLTTAAISAANTITAQSPRVAACTVGGMPATVLANVQQVQAGVWARDNSAVYARRAVPAAIDPSNPKHQQLLLNRLSGGEITNKHWFRASALLPCSDHNHSVERYATIVNDFVTKHEEDPVALYTFDPIDDSSLVHPRIARIANRHNDLATLVKRDGTFEVELHGSFIDPEFLNHYPEYTIPGEPAPTTVADIRSNTEKNIGIASKYLFALEQAQQYTGSQDLTAYKEFLRFKIEQACRRFNVSAKGISALDVVSENNRLLGVHDIYAESVQLTNATVADCCAAISRMPTPLYQVGGDSETLPVIRSDKIIVPDADGHKWAVPMDTASLMLNLLELHTADSRNFTGPQFKGWPEKVHFTESHDHGCGGKVHVSYTNHLLKLAGTAAGQALLVNAAVETVMASNPTASFDLARQPVPESHTVTIPNKPIATAAAVVTNNAADNDAVRFKM